MGFRSYKILPAIWWYESLSAHLHVHIHGLSRCIWCYGEFDGLATFCPCKTRIESVSCQRKWFFLIGIMEPWIFELMLDYEYRPRRLMFISFFWITGLARCYRHTYFTHIVLYALCFGWHCIVYKDRYINFGILFGNESIWYVVFNLIIRATFWSTRFFRWWGFRFLYSGSHA